MRYAEQMPYFSARQHFTRCNMGKVSLDCNGMLNLECGNRRQIVGSVNASRSLPIETDVDDDFWEEIAFVVAIWGISPRLVYRI